MRNWTNIPFLTLTILSCCVCEFADAQNCVLGEDVTTCDSEVTPSDFACVSKPCDFEPSEDEHGQLILSNGIVQGNHDCIFLPGEEEVEEEMQNQNLYQCQVGGLDSGPYDLAGSPTQVECVKFRRCLAECEVLAATTSDDVPPGFIRNKSRCKPSSSLESYPTPNTDAWQSSQRCLVECDPEEGGDEEL